MTVRGPPARRASPVSGALTIALMAHWLVKSEPGSFSIDDLERKGVEHWDGVRNYMARNNLMAMKVGDLALLPSLERRSSRCGRYLRSSARGLPRPHSVRSGVEVLRSEGDAGEPALVHAGCSVRSQVPALRAAQGDTGDTRSAGHGISSSGACGYPCSPCPRRSGRSSAIWANAVSSRIEALSCFRRRISISRDGQDVLPRDARMPDERARLRAHGRA